MIQYMAKNEVDKVRVGGKEMKNYEAPEFLPLSYSNYNAPFVVAMGVVGPIALAVGLVVVLLAAAALEAVWAAANVSTYWWNLDDSHGE